jgi:hypothetical protein
VERKFARIAFISGLMTRAGDEDHSLNHISVHIAAKMIGAVKRFGARTVFAETV